MSEENQEQETPESTQLETLEVRLAGLESQLGETEGTKQWRQEREAELTHLSEALEGINQRLANSETNLETAITNLTASMENLTQRLQQEPPTSENAEDGNQPNNQENPEQQSQQLGNQSQPSNQEQNGNTPSELKKRRTRFI
jgi:hypothetical protein